MLLSFVLIVVASDAQQLRNWIEPTEPDNWDKASAFLLDGSATLTIPAGGAPRFLVFQFDTNNNWIRKAVLDKPPDSLGKNVNSDPRTNLVVVCDRPTPTNFIFYRINATSGEIVWDKVGEAAAAIEPGENYVDGAIGSASVVYQTWSGDEKTVWQSTIGQAPAQVFSVSNNQRPAIWHARSDSYIATLRSNSTLISWAWNLSSRTNPAVLIIPDFGENDTFSVNETALWTFQTTTELLSEFVLPSSTTGREIRLPGQILVSRVYNVASDVIFFTQNRVGGYELHRYGPRGTNIYSVGTPFRDFAAIGRDIALVRVNPAGNGNNDTAALIRLSDGAILNHRLFGDNGPATGFSIFEDGVNSFAVKACFWADVLEIREVDPVVGPLSGLWWTGGIEPVGSNEVVFRVTAVGTTQTVTLVVSNSSEWPMRLQSYLDTDGSPSQFVLLPQAMELAGHTNATIEVGFKPEREGEFRARLMVTPSYGGGTGLEIALEGQTANDVGHPVIVKQPQDQLTRLGAGATFKIEAGGAPSLTYQWLHNEDPVNGATNALFFISPVRLSDAGPYKVRVSNGYGNVLSEVATLTPLSPDTEPPSLLPLTVTRSQPGSITLSWISGPGIRLQRTTTLANPNWHDVPGSDGTNRMVINVSSGTAFYRLIQ